MGKSRRQEITWLEQRISWNALTLCCPRTQQLSDESLRWKRAENQHITDEPNIKKSNIFFSIKYLKFHGRSRTPRRGTKSAEKNNLRKTNNDVIIWCISEAKRGEQDDLKPAHLFLLLTFTEARTPDDGKKNC